VLTEAVHSSVASTTLTVGAPQHGARVLHFGRQLDIQNITTTSGDGHGASGPVTEDMVAAYIAKYATKTATTSGALDTPIHCTQCRGTGRTRPLVPCSCCSGTGLDRPPEELAVDAHTRRLVRTCWELACQPTYGELKLWRWAHTLGYRGHFTTKSRRYSTTLTDLRDARRTWQQEHNAADDALPAELPAASDDPRPAALPACSWIYTGRGYTPGEHLLAAHTRHRRAVARQLRHEGDTPPCPTTARSTPGDRPATASPAAQSDGTPPTSPNCSPSPRS
jgi:hypothetical protein